MKRIFLICMVIGALGILGAEGNCWVVGIALNQDDPKLIDVWNDFGFQFTKAFSDNSGTLFKKVQTRTLLGKEATRAAMLNAMNWLSQNAAPKDMVAVYIGCHGGTDPRAGWSMGTADNKEVSGKDFKSVAARIPCPVFFVIDTCGSGGFARPHKDDVPLPPNCVAICSCRAQQSTTNMLNIALHEGLWGKADFDKDGFVELDEVVAYVNARTREMQDVEGAAPKEKGKAKAGELPVIVRGDNIPADTKLMKTSDQLVAMVHSGDWYLGRVNKEMGDRCKVHVMGYSDDPKSDYFFFDEIAANHVFKLDGSVLGPVKVENEKGNKRPALLLSAEGDKFKVRFPLKKKNNEELVEKEKIEFLFASDPKVAPFLKKRGNTK